MRLLLALTLLIATLNAEHIRWQHGFDEALFMAKELNKDILFLLLKKDDSKEVFNKVFGDEEVVKLVNDRFVSVVAFYEDRYSYPVELFYTYDFPTLFLVSSKDESFLTKPLSGDFSKDEVLKVVTPRRLELR
ncbi:MAG: hypothetical protein WC144_05490 [Sulfurimonas sp.]|nr:hypothetical protein [Sulfurimonadaceae bacterium]